MGSYITRTDVEARLRRNYETLYTPKGDSVVDTSVVDADIESAEATVESAVGTRYALPVTDAAALRVMKAWSLTLLEELAYGAVPGREIPANVESRVERVYKLLEGVRTGKVELPFTGTAPAAEEREDSVALVQIETPEFTRTKLEGF